MKWHDESNTLDRVAISTLSNKTPLIADCCDKPDVHLHAHKGWGRHPDRASAWIWCSHCGLYAHLDGIPIHTDWKNNPNVDFSKVCAVPIYLETVKDKVDAHLRMFLKN